jgi:undecaprenyl-diphosphatase
MVIYMDLLKAIFLGLIQGIAEFLPVSSSGHLAIMKFLLHMETDTGLLFDVLLHLGTLAAIFIAFWKDIKELIVEGFKIIGDFFINISLFFANNVAHKKLAYKKVISTPYRKFVMLVIVSTIPTGIIGVVFEDAITLVGETLLVPGLCLVLTGILLSIADRVKTGTKQADNVSYGEAGLIGLAQGIATLPGLSRSGTTITACLLAGFDRSFAVKYSFIMSIPAVLGAAVLQLKDFSMDMVSSGELVNYAIGTVIAGVVGYISIKTMLMIVRGKKFKYFAYYCFIIGILAVVGYFVI